MNKLRAIAVLLLLAVTGSSFAANPKSYPPKPEALAALASDTNVAFTQGSFYYSFAPVGAKPAKGFVFYPGGLVDHRAYAPLAKAIAARGYRTVVVEMPGDIAFLGIDRATLSQLAFRDTRRWAIGGHSLGGVAACSYAKKNPNRVVGLALIASYPSSSDNLRTWPRPVSSIYGTLDGLTDATDIEKSKRLLPAATQFVPVAGGNHTQCGAYWDGANPSFLQPGDNAATITAAQQEQAIADAICALLARM
jgi:pimeloyl-ACP methyl ester carboxylesterase